MRTDTDPVASASRLLTIDQVAELTTLSSNTLRWLRHRGEGPPGFRLGRRLVYRQLDVEAWINETHDRAVSKGAVRP